MPGSSVRRYAMVLVFLSVLLAVAVPCFAEEGRQGPDPKPVVADEPLVDLLALAANCSPLILPQARTKAQALSNGRARLAYTQLREALVTQVNYCAATTATTAGATQAPLLGKAGITVCGDCPECLSAASCEGCVGGAVCSKPGATPTRACRVLSSCGTDSNGNTVACCGCS